MEVRRLAGRFGLQGALGRYVATLSHSDLTRDARHAAADAIGAEARVKAALKAVRDLMVAASGCGVEGVLVKGIALTVAGLYATGERDVFDADLLVAPRVVPALKTAARTAGLDWRDLPPGGHEVAYVGDEGGSVEIHTALAGDAGRDAGPEWEAVRPFAVPVGEEKLGGALFVLTGQPARELAVQHFVRHHDGDPTFALRTLQDLSRLEGPPATEEPSLPWRRDAAGLRQTVERLRCLAKALREAGPDLPESANLFLTRLGMLLATSSESEAEYASTVDRWMRMQGGAIGRAALIVQSLREAPGGERGPKRLARPFRILRRYLSGKAQQLSKGRKRARAATEWRALLERG